jgi:hypothetical protein
MSRFEWSINGNTGFLTDGSYGAIAEPISFNGSVAGIEQSISLVGQDGPQDFVLKCEAVQFEFDHRNQAIKL